MFEQTQWNLNQISAWNGSEMKKFRKKGFRFKRKLSNKEIVEFLARKYEIHDFRILSYQDETFSFEAFVADKENYVAG